MTACRSTASVHRSLLLVTSSNRRKSLTATRLGSVAAVGFALLLNSFSVAAKPAADQEWQSVVSSNGSTATARHEAGAVVVNGKIFLFGGRGRGTGTRPVDRFDPATNRWVQISTSPMELHHFQPVAIGSKVYLVGAFTCCYPEETSVAEIHVFDTSNNTWSTQGNMPAARLRGAAGAIARNGKIYVIGGNTNGHSGGAVGWFDEFDPVTGNWQSLSDAPHARDHFQAVLLGNKLVATAGRTTIYPQVFQNAVAVTDVYDFNTGNWSTAANIPTLRAGAISVGVGSEVLVAGGEISGASENKALRNVEAFDINAGTWRVLQPLILGRHSGGGVVLGDDMHMMAGSLKVGGAPETTTLEKLPLLGVVDNDRDDDGLSNQLETGTHNTDPDDADSDDDGLDDGEEVSLGTDPNLSDTDSDTLLDGDEVNVHATSPKLADTDSDTLSDADEIAAGTNPTLADSDADGLDDGEEAQLGTNPLLPDTDGDGLNDVDEVNTHGSSPLLIDSDMDALDDRAEVQDHGTEPADADSDADGLDDGQEIEAGTNPLDSDSDDDGIEDGAEITAGSDPLSKETMTGEPAEPAEPSEPEGGEVPVTTSDDNNGGGAPGPMMLFGLFLLMRFRRAKSSTQ